MIKNEISREKYFRRHQRYNSKPVLVMARDQAVKVDTQKMIKNIHVEDIQHSEPISC